MADLLHGQQPGTTQSAATSARNARYGMVLFVLYLAGYVVYVGLSAFRPEVMDLVPAAGVNLAIWYGFALIVAALALALVYAWLCRHAVDELSGGTASQAPVAGPRTSPPGPGGVR